MQSLLYSIRFFYTVLDKMLFEKFEQKITLPDTPKPRDDFHKAVMLAFNQLPEIEIAFDIHYVTVQFKVYAQSFFDTANYITSQIKIQTVRYFGVILCTQHPCSPSIPTHHQTKPYAGEGQKVRSKTSSAAHLFVLSLWRRLGFLCCQYQCCQFSIYQQ